MTNEPMRADRSAEKDARCYCGMDAADHTESQGRCPRTPDDVRAVVAEVERFMEMFPADNGHILPPEVGQQ